METYNVVICDEDRGTVEALRNALPPGTSVFHGPSAGEARQILSSPSASLQAVYLSTDTAGSALLPLLRLCKSAHPSTPVHLITSVGGRLPLSEPEFERLHVEKVLHKPLNSASLRFEPAESRAAGAAEEKESIGSSSPAESFFPVRANSFLYGAKTFFDLYVRINEDKFVKIAEKGQYFDAARARAYLDKKVSFFYIKHDSHAQLIGLLDQEIAKMGQRINLSDSNGHEILEEASAKIFQHLQIFGIEPAAIGVAKKMVRHCYESVKKLEGPAFIKGLLEQLSQDEHHLGTVIIACLLLQAKEFEDKDLIENTALAAFLHDIGLYLLPGNFQGCRYENLDQNQKAEYEKHPTLGYELVSALPGMPTLTCIIILQHHERRNGKGYPSQLCLNSILPMAELVGVADAFHDFLLLPFSVPPEQIVNKFETSHLGQFSLSTLTVLRNAFGYRKQEI